MNVSVAVSVCVLFEELFFAKIYYSINIKIKYRKVSVFLMPYETQGNKINNKMIIILFLLAQTRELTETIFANENVYKLINRIGL